MGVEITKTGVILGAEGLKVKDLERMKKDGGARDRNRHTYRSDLVNKRIE